MFIRQCQRVVNGKQQAYWALVESYRTVRGPRQRVVAWLGKLDGNCLPPGAGRRNAPARTMRAASNCATPTGWSEDVRGGRPRMGAAT